MHEVIMPKLGLTMESGRIEKWHKKEGDRVEKGEILFEVMTDKVTIEVESYKSGVLKKILKAEGEEIPVTEVIAYIGEEDEEIPPEKPERKTESRKIGVETGETAGQTEDIIAYSKKKGETGKEAAASFAAGITIKSSGLLEGKRKLIAERMSYSWSNIPHIVLNAKANASRLIDLREELKGKIIKTYGIKITYTDFILKAAANALRNNLGLNSAFSDGKHIIYDDINIGLAVSSEEGLIVPTIFNCDRLKITDIAKKRIELINKVREGKFNLENISNGTFTVTNLGMYGIRSFSPIINPPQAAILAVGEIYTEPVVVNGKIKLESFINLSVSCDHRIIDGMMGAKFLREVVELTENPAELVN